MKGRITTKNNKMVAIISLPKDPITGKYAQKLISALPYESKKDLEIRMNQFIYQMQSKNIKNIKRITFGSFLSQWIEKHANEIQPTTLDGYMIYINNHIIPALGNKLLNEIKPCDIEDFYTEQLKKYKRRTIMQMHSIISKSFKYAFDNRMILDNPMQYVNVPKKNEKFVPDIYDEKEYAKLLKIVKGTVDEIYITLAGGLGLRLSEIFGLTWNDIDFENYTITINNAIVKTSKGFVNKVPKTLTSNRTISVGKRIMNLLVKWKEQHPESTHVVEQFNPNTYSGHFNLLLRNNGLHHIRFHDLRHFNATVMLNNGIEDKIASARLGHSSVQTTREIYQHVLKQIDEKAANKLDKLFD